MSKLKYSNNIDQSESFSQIKDMCKFDERDAFYTFVRCTFVMPVLKAGRTDWKTLKRSFLTYKTHQECPVFKHVNSNTKRSKNRCITSISLLFYSMGH